MFNFPAETFWWFVPWPIIWMALAVVMYLKLKREDDREFKKGEETSGS